MMPATKCCSHSVGREQLNQPAVKLQSLRCGRSNQSISLNFGLMLLAHGKFRCALCATTTAESTSFEVGRIVSKSLQKAAEVGRGQQNRHLLKCNNSHLGFWSDVGCRRQNWGPIRSHHKVGASPCFAGRRYLRPH